jgi:hypothetical protein
MTIKATCVCGLTFKAKSSLVGKKVKCPSCDQSFTVSLAPNDESKMRVVCHCGKAYRVGAKLAGQSAKCTSCGASFKIPALTAAAQSSQEQQATNNEIDSLGLKDSTDPLGPGNGLGEDLLATGFDDRLAATVPNPDSAPVEAQPPADTPTKTRPMSKRVKLKRAAGGPRSVTVHCRPCSAACRSFVS